MRFTILALASYLFIHLVGTATADISGIEIPQLKIHSGPESYLEFDSKHPGFSLAPQTKDQFNFLPCDGYPSNSPSNNFCSKTVPEGWSAREFNGQRYYMVPLKQSKGAGVSSELK